MKYLKHFFVFSFRWQLKLFLIINVFTLFSMYVLSSNTSLITSYGFLFSYLMFGYPLISISISLGSLSTNQNPSASSFSGKYLLSLPISKIDLIISLIISNLFSFFPMLISILWAKVFWDVNSFNLSDSTKKNLIFVLDHPIYFSSLILFLCIIFMLMLIRQGVELPRKLFLKGTMQSFLISVRSFINFIIFLMLFSVSLVLSIECKSRYIVLMFSIVMILLEFYKTFRVMLDEELTYFSTKRDFSLIALKLLLIICSGFLLNYLDTSKYRFQEGSWPQKYSEGDKIFYSMLNNNTSEVLDYLHRNGKLDIVNKYGVSLIHVFASMDLSKDKQLEDYFLKNINLALTPMHTIAKVCKKSYYCEGVTPVHILASSKNTYTLKKILELLPAANKVTNLDDELPLHYASATCYYETVKVLMDAKVEVNKVSKDHLTPLMVSAEKGCFASSLLLIKAGANKELKNSKGLTASELAKNKNHRELSFIIDNFN